MKTRKIFKSVAICLGLLLGSGQLMAQGFVGHTDPSDPDAYDFFRTVNYLQDEEGDVHVGIGKVNTTLYYGNPVTLHTQGDVRLEGIPDWDGSTHVLVMNPTTDWEVQKMTFANLATQLSNGGTFWSTSGNSITAGDFLGTSNAQDLVIKTSNKEYARLTSGGQLQVGNSTNKASVDVKADAADALSVNNTYTGTAPISRALSIVQKGNTSNSSNYGIHNVVEGTSSTTTNVGHFAEVQFGASNIAFQGDAYSDASGTAWGGFGTADGSGTEHIGYAK